MERPDAGDEFKMGDRVWTVEPDEHYGSPVHGEVVAVGLDWVVVKFDGPWRNLSYRFEAVRTSSILKGSSPSIRCVGDPEGAESFNDHAMRCRRVLAQAGKKPFPFSPFTKWVSDPTMQDKWA